jgi:hypothetical protein
MSDEKKHPIKDAAVSRAKEPSSWAGALVLVGAGIGALVGKPTLADPMFWSSVLNVAAGLGLIAMPQKDGK